MNAPIIPPTAKVGAFITSNNVTHLIEAFASELKWYDVTGQHTGLIDDALALLDEAIVDCDTENEIFERLQYALEEYTPPYCYFGSNHRDPGTWGYFVDWELIRDGIYDGDIVQGADEPADKDEEHAWSHWLEVNDHGNATLWTYQPSTQGWLEVWSVV